jgi:curved DNA-binding protein CbpA
VPKVRTHYDNLKVARDAPIEVISAAYLILRKKVEEDTSLTLQQIQHVLQAIQNSYEVLSDPGRRSAHDTWIQRIESIQSEREKAQEANGKPREQSKPPKKPLPSPLGSFEALLIIGSLALIAVVAVMIAFSKAPDPKLPTAEAVDRSVSPFPKVSLPTTTYVLETPNKLKEVPKQTFRPEPILERSMEDPSFRPLFNSGLSEITIDNLLGRSHVEVKLCWLGARPTVVRRAFVKAGEVLTIESINAGLYDIRYRPFGTRQAYKVPKFELSEERTDGSIVSSVYRVTLYEVPGGNLRKIAIDESDFELEPTNPAATPDPRP